MTDDELRDYIPKEIARCERQLVRYREMADPVQTSDHEIRMGGSVFARKYERELAILRLAQKAQTP